MLLDIGIGGFSGKSQSPSHKNQIISKDLVIIGLKKIRSDEDEYVVCVCVRESVCEWMGESVKRNEINLHNYPCS